MKRINADAIAATTIAYMTRSWRIGATVSPPSPTA